MVLLNRVGANPVQVLICSVDLVIELTSGNSWNSIYDGARRWPETL